MRRLTVTYLGAPSQDSPLGDVYLEVYDDVIGYSYVHTDTEQTLRIVHRKNGQERTVEYPESKVIRSIFQQGAA